ncbi:hypothetical protein [Methanotorris igneus]|uniref:Uncharacterized protein n=1 Tax=Methanotorris igneus (strain DSM 5666 / JCM 11834 / Kol 5) TaxID=880724 RepID=F6BAV7_METIK|nr:hypothetical protein [Methanotorris igneus]AEF97044.1 hypothetical protein Metig_1510 [Methanotorris igneus Kol 5]
MNILRVIGGLCVIFGISLGIYGYLEDIFYFFNIGVGLILIGSIMTIFSYEKYEYDINTKLFNDYIDLIKRLIRSLEIENKGIVISKGGNIRSGVIFLPIEKDYRINLSLIDENILLVNSDNKKEMGLVFPLLGKSMLKILEREEFSNINTENLEDCLSYTLSLFNFGGDVVVEFKGREVIINYRIKNAEFCERMQKEKLCERFPCHVCGFIILVISRVLNRMLKIEEIKKDKDRIRIRLMVLENEV